MSWIQVTDQYGNPAMIDTNRVLVVRDDGDTRGIVLRRGGGETYTVETLMTMQQIWDLLWLKTR